VQSKTEPKARILVIDDELGIREGCRRALSPHGYQVEVAENGPAGLRKIREEGPFEVLLLDAMMPGMSGVEVLKRCCKADPLQICVIITGYATVDLAVQATREGAYDFVAKPFSADTLLMTVDRALEHRQLLKERERLRAIEEEMREAARARVELQKLDAVQGRFMVNMVHVMRAPVAVMQSYTQMMRQGYISQEQYGETLQRIEERAGSVLETLDDLLLLAHLRGKVGESTMKRVSVAEVLEEVAAGLQERAEAANLQLSLEMTDRPVLWAHRDHIAQLWRNLLTNAIQYTPAGGQVMALLHEEAEGQIVGAVRDTGIGLKADEIPRIFEDFFRTDAAKKMRELGSGLGMGIVQNIVELYGGTIEVESELGQGSTFTFILPPQPPPTEAEDLVLG
jgi:two-component system sensor histidine kinase/response regulator